MRAPRAAPARAAPARACSRTCTTRVPTCAASPAASPAAALVRAPVPSRPERWESHGRGVGKPSSASGPPKANVLLEPSRGLVGGLQIARRPPGPLPCSAGGSHRRAGCPTALPQPNPPQPRICRSSRRGSRRRACSATAPAGSRLPSAPEAACGSTPTAAGSAGARCARIASCRRRTTARCCRAASTSIRSSPPWRRRPARNWSRGTMLPFGEGDDASDAMINVCQSGGRYKFQELPSACSGRDFNRVQKNGRILLQR